MSSDPDQTFSTSSDTKQRINKATTDDSDEEKITIHRNYADNFVASQLAIHESIPITNPDTELQYLSSSLAAAEYNFWTSKDEPKDDLIDECIDAEKRIEDYIIVTYGRKNSNGLSGEDTFGTTSAITGDF